ncbi:MAG: hypothetical protein FJ291_16445 [Planctomycetes bacterium]|nr:hypothetical protein [Planctomycetota bacterium]
MSDSPTQAEILVDVEPANKTFRIRVENATTVADLVNAVLERCEADGINVRRWARDRVGRENVSLVLMRKAQGSAALPPTIEFGRIEPVVQPDERFSLDATAIVG